MSRKVPQQSLPHYGVKNGWKRDPGTSICRNVDGRMRLAGSISRAKRFMRTGHELRG